MQQLCSLSLTPLIHRLWGNPDHLTYMASALREKYTEGELYVLVAESNANNLTYDGIETGAERVTQEVEDCIARLEKEGTKIKKLSMCGYSLGGLIARYSIGLLYSNGWFDRLEPVNFTTFASPHLGVRTPILGIHSRLWNVLGSRTLSTSGRQLFSIDTFRDTGRPLLCLLADPHSIFMQALALFKHRVLYANIINDRSAPYYTTFITTVDPYIALNGIDIHYIKDYDPNIIDTFDPVSKKSPLSQSLLSRVASSSRTVLGQLPIYAAMAVLLPIGSVVFLANAGVQSIRSSKRIKLHESGQAGATFGGYRIPLMLENARSAVEGTYNDMNGNSEHLPAGTGQDTRTANRAPQKDGKSSAEPTHKARRRSSAQQPTFPTLNLSPEQFEMIENLDHEGFWRKYAVHIHDVTHTHAAIIVRSTPFGRKFEEGKRIIAHWLHEEFEA